MVQYASTKLYSMTIGLLLWGSHCYPSTCVGRECRVNDAGGVAFFFFLAAGCVYVHMYIPRLTLIKGGKKKT
jgi:hypothetical protein